MMPAVAYISIATQTQTPNITKSRISNLQLNTPTDQRTFCCGPWGSHRHRVGTGKGLLCTRQQEDRCRQKHNQTVAPRYTQSQPNAIANQRNRQNNSKRAIIIPPAANTGRIQRRRGEERGRSGSGGLRTDTHTHTQAVRRRNETTQKRGMKCKTGR